ncbi:MULTISPECIES: antibiotic biosynthesis monooxygenase [Actinomycetes]
MITEHAILPVSPGRESEFEAAFAQARPLISSMPGFLRLELLHHFYDPFPRVEHFTEVRS